MKGLPGWVVVMTVAAVAVAAADGGEWVDAVTMEDVQRAEVAVEIVCQPDGSYRVKEELRGSGESLGLLFHAMGRLGIRHGAKGLRSFLYLHWQGTQPLEALRTRRLPEVMNPMAVNGRPYVRMGKTGGERCFFDYRVVLVGKDLWRGEGSRRAWW